MTEAVRRISGEENEIVGASRTDSGAHAKGQVCHFDTAKPMPPERWAQVINRALPLDLAVLRSNGVRQDFHSRFCALDRTYRYSIAIGENDPFIDRFAFRWHEPLNLRAMQSAAQDLVGAHDFRAFSESLPPDTENTVRRVHKIELGKAGTQIRLQVTATAFLRGMMRRIAGFLWDVGRGQREPDQTRFLLGTGRDQIEWPVVLPARGLTLMRVRYGRHPVDYRTRQETASIQFGEARERAWNIDDE